MMLTSDFTNYRWIVESFVMRKGIAFVLLAVGLLVLAWVAHSKVAEARREAAYRAAVARFERDLRLGMDRAEVQTYLASRKVDYHPVRYGGSDALEFPPQNAAAT